jgi:hypothetical protein
MQLFFIAIVVFGICRFIQWLADWLDSDYVSIQEVRAKKTAKQKYNIDYSKSKKKSKPAIKYFTK